MLCTIEPAWGAVAKTLHGSIMLCATSFLLAAAAVEAVVPGDAQVEPHRPHDELPHEFYAAAAARGAPVYRIDALASQVLIFVYRAGLLARLGHDHVVASHDVTGYILWADAPDVARADLHVPLATLTVDEAELRAAAGFETVPSDDDIAGTRDNMLASIDAAAFPVLRVLITRQAAGSGDPSAVTLHAEVTLHGVSHSFPVTVELERDADRLRVSGSFDVLQSDFGIRPFSVFGGALAVRDRLDVRFHLEGRRTGRE